MRICRATGGSASLAWGTAAPKATGGRGRVPRTDPQWETAGTREDCRKRRGIGEGCGFPGCHAPDGELQNPHLGSIRRGCEFLACRRGEELPRTGDGSATGEESDRTTGERGAQAGERVDENPSIPSLLILLHNIGESSTGFRRGVPQGEGERLQGIGLPSEYRGIAG